MTLEEILTEVAKGSLSVEEAALRIRQMSNRPRPPGPGRPRAMRGPPLVLALIFTAVAVVLTALAVGFGLSAQRFAASADRTEGTVIRLQETGNKGMRAPVIHYTVADQLYEFQSSISRNPPSYAVGDKVTVIYHAERPGDGRIDSFFELWFLPLLLGGLGLVFGCIGLGLLVARWRRPFPPLPLRAGMPAQKGDLK
jgi:hypothetical protein